MRRPTTKCTRYYQMLIFDYKSMRVSWRDNKCDWYSWQCAETARRQRERVLRLHWAYYPYLEGCWAQLQWPFCPPHSGSGRMAGIALPSLPLLQGCVLDPWAAQGSSLCKPCGCLCQTRRGPPPPGPWPDNIYVQGLCLKEKADKVRCQWAETG